MAFELPHSLRDHMIDDNRETAGCRFRGRVVQVRARYMALCNATSRTWQLVKFTTAETQLSFFVVAEMMAEKEGERDTHTQFRVTSHVTSWFAEDPSAARSSISLVICKSRRAVAYVKRHHTCERTLVRLCTFVSQRMLNTLGDARTYKWDA